MEKDSFGLRLEGKKRHHDAPARYSTLINRCHGTEFQQNVTVVRRSWR